MFSFSQVQFQEIPGVLKDSKLCLWPQKQHRLPSSFAWLTGAGVYYGTLAFGSQEPGESVFIEKNLIPYPSYICNNCSSFAYVSLLPLIVIDLN